MPVLPSILIDVASSGRCGKAETGEERHRERRALVELLSSSKLRDGVTPA